MSTNLHPDIAKGVPVPKGGKKPGAEKALARSIDENDRTDGDRPESGETAVRRAAERNHVNNRNTARVRKPA